MSFSSRKGLPPTFPSSGLASQSTQQPWLVCTWSAHAPLSGLPFPRNGHTLTATATVTAASELVLFGGYVHGCASSDLYVFSTRDFSTTLWQTSGEAPTPRVAHGAALVGTTLLICGGKTNGKTNFGDQNVLNHDAVYLLNLVSREWTRVVIDGPGLNDRHYPTTTVVGSKLFVFGGRIGGKIINDMWTLDLNRLKSQPFWESYEPIPGNEKPLPRARHVSVPTEDCIIIFGGYGDHYYNDTWSFDISTRQWTKLQCTGSIPSPRASHAAVFVDGVMYVFGGYSSGEGYLDDLYALQLSTRRWFKFYNLGTSPCRRLAHAMASDGTRVFVLGGYSADTRSDELSLIHVFDTKDIKYPEPERSPDIPNEKITQLPRWSSVSPTQGQRQHLKSFSLETNGASHLQNATPALSDSPGSLQITHERNPSPNVRPLELTGVNSKPRRVLEDDVGEGSTEYHAKFAARHSSSEGEIAPLELEQHLSVLLAAHTGPDHHIAQLTDGFALKSSLFEQAEANPVEAGRCAGPELREHGDDGRLMRTSPVKQTDEELVDMQSKLDELAQSHDQQISQYEKKLADAHAKLEAKESELEAIRLRLADAEKGWAKSKAEADTLRAQAATGSVNGDEDKVARRLVERVRAIEAEMASRLWNEKSIEEMECRNEG